MEEFFKKMFFKGMRILLVVFVFWILYFVINFFYPNLFNFLRTNNDNIAKNTLTSSSTKDISLGEKIYNIFFKGDFFTFKNNSSTTTSKKDNWSNNEPVIWGSSPNTSNFNNQQIDFNKISNNNIFIFPNLKDSPIQNMRINNILIDSKVPSVLENGSIITGTIFTGYNNTYYFDMEIYTATGDKIFSIPTNSSIDIKDDIKSNFTGIYRQGYNYENYTGDGFLIIRSNNPKVEGMVVVKIKIR